MKNNNYYYHAIASGDKIFIVSGMKSVWQSSDDFVKRTEKH